MLGYLDVPLVVEKLKSGNKSGELLVKDVFTKFDRRKSVGYQVITPDTSLEVLEEFLKEHNFAIGMKKPGKKSCFFADLVSYG